MSNIDKQTLIAKIKKQTESYDTVVLREDEANALLDELEAKDNRINRLEAIVAVAEQRNALMREWKRVLRVPCDLIDDQVPVVIHSMVIRLERLKEAEDKLTAAEKKTVEMPTFDGYVSHVARELQAAFRIACDNAGINVAAAGKGEAS